MNVIGLVSGGKDSIYALQQCIHYGHTIIALAHLSPPIHSDIDELDNYCFQTIGHQLVKGIAECMDLPLYTIQLPSTHTASINTSLHYTYTANDEIEYLYTLLQYIKTQHPTINAVSSGAILSNYQRLRIESVCTRLALTSLAYLWQCDQSTLYDEMIHSNLHAILVKVSSAGLSAQKHLNQSLSSLRSHIHHIYKQYGVNICGEGGEYETLTLDCMLYKKRIIVDESIIVSETIDEQSGDSVGYLKIMKWHLESKKDEDILSSSSMSVSSDVSTSSKYQHIVVPSPPHEDTMNGINDTLHNVNINDDTHISSNESSNSMHANQLTPLNESHSASDYVSIICTVDVSFTTTIQQQTHFVFQSLLHELKQHHASISDIFYINLILNDMNDFVTVNELYSTYIPMMNCPSRTCIQLALPHNAHIMLQCIAKKPSHALIEKYTSSQHNVNDNGNISDINTLIHHFQRDVLHVQSISTWAPCCIGPYSQATTVDHIIHLAGQIGLGPATMTLPNDAKKQTENCCQHVNAVLQCTKSSYQHLISSVIYLDENVSNSDTQMYDEIMQTYNKCLPKHLPQIRLSVQGLPRRGLTELQCIAVEKYCPIPKHSPPKTIHVTTSDGAYTVTFLVTDTTRHFLSIWMMIRCNDTNNSLNHTLSTDVIRVCMEFMRKQSAFSKLETSTMISSRCFYTPSIHDAAACKNRIYEGWRNVSNDDSGYENTFTVAMFPVTSIDNQRENLLCCHFMFVQPYDINNADDSDDGV